MELTPPLKWHGGKHDLARRVVALFPPHIHYVEPFAGSLAVLLHRDPDGASEVVNDLSGPLTNFWAVLRDPARFARFERWAQASPFSESLFRECAAWLGGHPEPTPATSIEHACCFFVHCRQSLAGRMKSFTGITKTRVRRRMNNEVSAWLSAVEGLPAVHERMRRVLMVGPKPALEVIRQHDTPGTLFYCDGPYIQSTRTAPDVYAHEMTDDQHRELIATLLACKGKCVVSMYHHPIYDALHLHHGWRLAEFDMPNHAAGGATKKRMTECVWMNYASSEPSA